MTIRTIHLPVVAVICALFVFVAYVRAQQPAQHAGEYPAADIQYGATVYSAQCTQCHGPTGDQVSGVDLRTGRFRNATTDDDLRRIITQGIPNTSMPGRRLANPDATALIAYIRNMRDFDSKTVVVGDSARGRTLFEGKGRCTTCHRVDGTGSHVGPDLSDIGSSRSPGTIEQSLLDPTRRMLPINRPVRIVTREGRTITGRRLNEDTYTVQLIDDQERLVSVEKSAVREYAVLQTSAMPSVKGMLEAQEVADVIAYLASLKGR